MATSSSTGAHNDGASATKVALHPANWTRKDRPCDACRRRKSRCIIPPKTETCIMCQSREEVCTFLQSPQRRKRRRLEPGENNPETGKPPSPDSDRSIPGKSPINDYTALAGPSLLKQTLGLQNRQHSQYLGQTTEYDTRLINLSSFNGKGEYVSVPGTLRRVNHETHFIMKSETQSQIDEEVRNLDLVESIVRPHGKALVDLYFRIIHPSFPIMDKKVFREKYARTYREFTPPIMAAVYILALNWWSYSPDLVNLQKPDVEALEKMIPKMMADVLNRPKLSTVQAGLLLLQRPDGDSWALTGQLVAVSQNLGLHLDCTRWRLPEWERSLRKRLAWALYMQDKWGALVHGRPPLIHSEDWAVRPVEKRDFPETAEDDDEEEGSSEVEKGRLIFVHMISLTEILADILKSFFTLRATTELENEGMNAMMVTLERAKPVQLRLKDWYSKLPQSLAIKQTKARKLSSTGSLHLAYFAAEVTLHRAIIRFDQSSTDDNLRSITRTAANMRFLSAIDLVNRLELTHLQSFWYFSSKVNLAIIATFGSLLWATSDSSGEADFYRSQLAEYRWTLRVSSKAAEFMRFTVGMLDASAVFVRDSGSKISSPPIAREQASQNGGDDIQETKHQQQNHQSEQNSVNLQSQDQIMQDSSHYFGTNKTSPSITNSTENAYSYDTELRNPGANFESDGRASWTETANFTAGGSQDWSLDRLYGFENIPGDGIEDVLGNRRAIEEYDETGNNFAGF